MESSTGPHKFHAGEVIEAVSKAMPRVSLGTLLEGYQLVSRSLILQKMSRIKTCLESKAMLQCFPFCLKYTAIERSSTIPRATGEIRSGDILGVKVVD